MYFKENSSLIDVCVFSVFMAMLAKGLKN